MPDRCTPQIDEQIDELERAALQAQEEGRLQEAAKGFRAAGLRAQDARTGARLHEMAAQCFLEAEGLDSEALQEAERAVALQPAWADAWVTLGRAHLVSGGFFRAAQCLSRALALGAVPHVTEPELEEALSLAQREVASRVGLLTLRLPHLSRRGDDDSGPSGPAFALWECGLALAEYLVKAGVPGGLRGRRVLELGSGAAGTAGIAAALCGAHVTLTDLPPVLPALREVVDAHRAGVEAAGGSAAVAELNWGRIHAGDDDRWAQAAEAFFSCDVLLGADLVFSAKAVPALLSVVRRVVEAGEAGPTQNGKVEVLLAHKSRHAEVEKLLFEGLEGLGVRLAPVGRSAVDAQVTVYART